MTAELNHWYRLLDKSNPSAQPFVAIVTEVTDKGIVTFAEKGKAERGATLADFDTMVVAEVEGEEPHQTLEELEKAKTYREGMHKSTERVVPRHQAVEQHTDKPRR